MPPTDITPTGKVFSGFELVSSSEAFNKIPVQEFKSTKTGLTVVIADVEGPIVNGYFCLVTEAFDDDGLPHTLEHLIFLGSEDYPFKGVLDLLANRCLASGTNAWTDTDHTCYTMETAGSEGFLSLMPIFLDHILNPILSEEGFTTEVHHITGEGEDAGVVYCEMQGRENSAESRMQLALARKLYPGKCGYSSETGGIMKNLRESCNNIKVKNYHKEFYRPENLKVIITGQVNPDDVFKTLEKLEHKICLMGDRGEFKRPWQSEVPPVESSEHMIIKYPSDEEKNGVFAAGWRGPSAVKDQYKLRATTMLMKYLTELSVSPLPKEFVEIPDPYASKVSHGVCENSEASLFFTLENVPKEKLHLVKEKLDKILKKLVDEEDIDMKMMQNIINRYKLESWSDIETSPHIIIAFMLIQQMLYGTTQEDFQQRLNPLVDLERMSKEPKEFWVNLLKEYFVDGKQISIEGVPSIEEQQRMALEESKRVEELCKILGEDGLKKAAKKLEHAIEFNERPPPDSMLTSIPIPSIESIKFHSIKRYQTGDKDSAIDLEKTPVFTYFDHVETNFVHIYALMDTSSLAMELRPYLPLLLETLFESPISRNDQIIPYEEVVAELHNDTVSTCGALGLGNIPASLFKCGNYSHMAVVMLQVESGKFQKGASWLRELLYQTIFDEDRLKIVATKMVNNVAQAKRSGRDVVGYVVKGFWYSENSNAYANGILKQYAFLTDLLKNIGNGTVSETMESVRKAITHPENLSLYCAANLDIVKNVGEVLNDILPSHLLELASQKPMRVLPDYKLIFPLAPLSEKSHPSCIVAMGFLESSYMFQSTPSIKSITDPDTPPLLVYLQYLTQAEGPMWKQIRGKGFAYSYGMSLKTNQGLLHLGFSRATNVVGAYKEAYEIVKNHLKSKEWDNTLIESAKSSLIFEYIDEEKTVNNVVTLSLRSYFDGVDYKHNRTMLGLINKVTIEDLNRVAEKYVAPLFEADKVKTVIVCNPSKAEEIKAGFEKLGQKLVLYPSLEESFLKI